MNWSDERYVRLYTRDTPEWQCLSFMAQGLFCLLMRKVNRAGVLPLGKLGRRGVAVGVCFPGDWSRLEPALDELLADGCVVINGDRLVIPNFIEAQECEASDRARAKKHRELARDGVLSAPSQNVTAPSENRESRDGSVTKRDGEVTECDQTVTPSRTEPSRAVPSQERREETVARLPSRSDLLAQKYPATDRVVVEGGFIHASKPETRDAVEAAVVAAGHEAALAAARASFARNGKTHMGWHLDAIRSAVRPAPAPTYVADLTWLDHLAPERRVEAQARWDELEADARQRFNPDGAMRALAGAAEMLRQKFAS